MKGSDQFAARPINDEMLANWLWAADTLEAVMRPGDYNWPMVVRSLIAEIERLRARQ